MDYKQTDTAKGVLMILRSLDSSEKIDKLKRSMNYVTTLVQCPRKVVWRNESDVIDFEAQENMIRGTSIHTVLEKGQILSEIRVEWQGIRGRIDFIGNYPVEIFTTAIGGDFEPDKFPYKINQLLAYLKMLQSNNDKEKIIDFNKNTPKGELMLFQLFKKKGERKLTSWLIEPSQKEIDDNWNTIIFNRSQIEIFTRTKQIPDMNPITTSEYWECRSCEFYNRCYSDTTQLEDASIRFG